MEATEEDKFYKPRKVPAFTDLVERMVTKTKEYDTVECPRHYNSGSIECIDSIKESLDPDGFKGYLKGNVQKYLWRYKQKNGVEDLRKAKWYLDRLIKEEVL